jgi:ABC-type phosphate transport system substrate-binding protein
MAMFTPMPVFADTVVIRHPSVNGQELSRDSLVRIYAMKKRAWNDGSPITVYILSKNSQAHRSFVTGQLKMQPFHLNRLWNRMIFSGVGTPPIELSSQTEMLNKIRNTPGAIGYVDKEFAQEKQLQELMVSEDE